MPRCAKLKTKGKHKEEVGKAGKEGGRSNSLIISEEFGDCRMDLDAMIHSPPGFN